MADDCGKKNFTIVGCWSALSRPMRSRGEPEVQDPGSDIKEGRGEEKLKVARYHGTSYQQLAGAFFASGWQTQTGCTKLTILAAGK